MTPLQRMIEELIAAHERRHGRRLSGRQIADRLGKSRNHLSQIMNDGLVPSGETLFELAEILEAEPDQKDRLVMAAIETKAGARSRDAFWLRKALELLEELGRMKDFLDEKGQAEAFRRWLGAATEDDGDREAGSDADQTGA